jgi:hypothetical protein
MWDGKNQQLLKFFDDAIDIIEAKKQDAENHH